MPNRYIPEPADLPDSEALKYARLMTRLDPHVRALIYALIRRLCEDQDLLRTHGLRG